jgi:hypothetical protein
MPYFRYSNMEGNGGSQTSFSQTSGQKRKREDDVSKYGAEYIVAEIPSVTFVSSIQDDPF